MRSMQRLFSQFVKRAASTSSKLEASSISSADTASLKELNEGLSNYLFWAEEWALSVRPYVPVRLGAVVRSVSSVTIEMYALEDLTIKHHTHFLVLNPREGYQISFRSSGDLRACVGDTITFVMHSDYII